MNNQEYLKTFIDIMKMKTLYINYMVCTFGNDYISIRILVKTAFKKEN
jgi:hypothetical protein